MDVLFRKLSPVSIGSRLFLTFSSLRFSVSGFMSRSLIYLSFVQGDKYGSICMLLHSVIQLDQQHLLKMLSFSHCMLLTSLSKTKYSLMCGLISESSTWFHWSACLSIFMPIPCCYYYYCSAVQLEIRDGDTSRSSFIVQDCFSYPRFFVFPYEVEHCSFKVCKELHWGFDGDSIESVYCSWFIQATTTREIRKEPHQSHLLQPL